MYRDGHASAGVGTRPIRCAIYTRKSTDEGLDQAFNSLDAQYEACSSYIASQRHEGWTLDSARYDDGGFSGGSMERPALKRLLADVAAGKVDVIVLYKIDRLTRALSDFARIVEVLDRAGASFVSVTQAFNTTTSMGRLTLNVLLSFAQFEREVGAERVRDKIAASKRKGMWMGGVVPLGYRVEARKLLPVPAEVDIVRHIFARYCALGSVPNLEAELDRANIRSRKGNALGRGALYTLLANRLYVGEITHRDAAYPGEHEGIVERGVFDEARAMLARNRTERQHCGNADEPSLLAGLLYDTRGQRMGPTHSCKGSRRYRYYASNGARPVVRVPASAVETLVLNRIAAFLRDGSAVDAVLEPLGADAVTLQAITYAARRAAQAGIEVASSEQRDLILKLIDRIDMIDGGVRIHINPSGLYALADLPPVSIPSIALDAPALLVRRAREVRMLVAAPAGDRPTEIDTGLVKLLVKAHAARRALFEGDGTSLAEVAGRLGYEPGYFTVLVKLAFLVPDITAAVLAGRQPATLTRQRLARIRGLPMLWDEQRTVLAVGG